jgi:hypothetical protein
MHPIVMEAMYTEEILFVGMTVGEKDEGMLFVEKFTFDKSLSLLENWNKIELTPVLAIHGQSLEK